jgi:hypothetical protein
MFHGECHLKSNAKSAEGSAHKMFVIPGGAKNPVGLTHAAIELDFPLFTLLRASAELRSG